MGLGPTNFFFLMPEQENLSQKLVDGVDFCSAFRDLGQEDVFEALMMLYKRPAEKFFTEYLLVKNMGVSEERAGEIIDILKKYGHIRPETVELDDDEVTMYRFQPRPYFVGLLLFVRDMTRPPSNFFYNIDWRSKPYLT